jgi:predicted TIM-barrel fold metal-dependent hydrolase
VGGKTVDYKVISTDNHINEPPGTYIDRVPAHLQDSAPRILRGADGGDGWSLDGKPPKTTFGLGATGAITGQNYKEYRASGIKFEELLPGNYQGADALKDNEADGVDAASIYPSAISQIYQLTNREMAVACVRAYNDWLIDEFCAPNPDRLLSLPFMPVNDGMPGCLAEANRVIAKGAKGLYLPLPDVAYHDTKYDPLWKIAIEAKVPVTIHRTGVSRNDLTLGAPDSAPGINVVGTVQRFFSAINPISNLIYTGVFDRFPDLVFIAAEVNCSWVPALAQQMDQEYERQQYWANLPFNSVPSTYLARRLLRLPDRQRRRSRSPHHHVLQRLPPQHHPVAPKPGLHRQNDRRHDRQDQIRHPRRQRHPCLRNRLHTLVPWPSHVVGTRANGASCSHAR